jgi:hypothetical protein
MSVIELRCYYQDYTALMLTVEGLKVEKLVMIMLLMTTMVMKTVPPLGYS